MWQLQLLLQRIANAAADATASSDSPLNLTLNHITSSAVVSQQVAVLRRLHSVQLLGICEFCSPWNAFYAANITS